jgi:glycosyltransferase involved in cell wall biosynthesis
MKRHHRLLFVSSRYLFPTDSGGKIRTVNVLRGMKGGAFDITLTSPLPSGARQGVPPETADVCDRFVGWPAPSRSPVYRWSRMLHLASSIPVAVATDYSSAGRQTISRALHEKPDVVVVDFPHAAVLAPPPYPCAGVMFTHNVEAEIFRRHGEVARNPIRRAIWRNQARKMERYERTLLRSYNTVVAVAERDAKFFEREYGLTNVTVIPTGVDLEYFTYGGISELDDQGGGTVVFTGSMDWLANVEGIEFFMDEVWPAIARARPRARCVIVGRTPPAALVERARVRRLNWHFTGFVDDVRPYVHDAHVYVIPLRVGGGTRIKVYEAMAMGCPVVSTRIGVEGLPVENEHHFLEADSAPHMATAVLSLLANRDRRERLSRQARHLVEDNMSARRAARVFEEACLRSLERTSS